MPAPKLTELEALESEFGNSLSFIKADLSNEANVLSLIDPAGLVTTTFDGFVANAALGADGLLNHDAETQDSTSPGYQSLFRNSDDTGHIERVPCL